MSKPDLARVKRILPILKRRGEEWDLNTTATRACKQERECETIINLSRVRVEMSWRALKMAKHSAVNEEAVVRGRLLDKEICSFGIWRT